MQIDLSCQLLQAKLFNRGSAQNTAPLLGLSLGVSICWNIPIGDLRLKRLAANITNPLLTISDGYFSKLFFFFLDFAEHIETS